MLRRTCVFLASLLAVVSLALPCSVIPAAAGTEKILYTFRGGDDGGWPWAPLLLDNRTGTLYGTTEVGGNALCQNYFQFGCGIIFALTPSPSGWAETVLYRFQGGNDGAHPRAPLFPRPDGYFYSTTTAGGGAIQGGIGTAFRIKAGTWQEQVIYRFTSYNSGAYPQGAIAFDGSGDLFGLTQNGGASGVAFELNPKLAGQWAEQVLYADIGSPYAGVITDSLGNVYGASDDNGVYNEGSVFELSQGEQGWQFANIYSFQDSCGMFCGGTQPGDLAADKRGNIFGFTGDAGLPNCDGFGCGTAFEMTYRDGKWQEKTLYEFRNQTDGWGPGYAAPAIDADGNIYGTTQGGGQYGYGTVFKLSHVNGGWTKTTLFNFPGGAGGNQPYGGVVVDQRGNIFGTTYNGGKAGGKTCKRYGCGIVFEVKP
jgi:uncharacterized repeat protein (TIGR03803 family)